MEATLYYMMGYPGSGKTTFAAQLARQLAIDHLYADRIAFQLFTWPTGAKHEVKAVRDEMEESARMSLQLGDSCIYDAMNPTEESRQNIKDLAESIQKPAIGIWVQTPKDVSRQRATSLRPSDFQENFHRRMPEELFVQYAAAFEEPDTTTNVIKISGADSFDKQFASFSQQLSEINSLAL